MKKEEKEKMLNLLADRALFGLDDADFAEFEALAEDFPAIKTDDSFELAAAAFSLVDLKTDEPLPSHLNSKILASADEYFSTSKGAPEEYQKTFAFEPRTSIWSRLGWAVAALACIALLANVWLTRIQPTTDIGGVPTPTPTASPLPKPEQSLAVQREQLLASANDVIQRNLTDFPKDPHGVTGDVVWSNSQQKGFIHFHNLPANDKTKESYQLWIADTSQNNPIDGGVFNVDQNGDVIIPVDARLKVVKPKMFVVTAEKPGGVVVSKLGKVMAIAKIET